MKIQTNKPDLEAVLSLVGVAEGQGKPDQVQNHLLFIAGPRGVEVCATNTRVSARGPMVANVEAEGQATLESWRLLKWLQALGDGEISLEASGGTVVASCASSRAVFQSLDPKLFREVPIAPQGGVEVDARRLLSLWTHLQNFVLDDETKAPHYNVAEVKTETFWAANMKALVIMSISELSKMNLRIHRMDFSEVLKFIAACKNRPISVVDHGTGGFFLVHPGGTSLHVPRPTKEFPDLAEHLSILKTEAPAVWEFAPEALTQAISGLSASSEKQNETLLIGPKGTDTLQVSMKAAFSDQSSTAWLPAKIRTKQSSTLPPILSVHYPSLSKALAKLKEGVALEVFPPDAQSKKVVGLARISQTTKEGDEIQNIFHWKVAEI